MIFKKQIGDLMNVYLGNTGGLPRSDVEGQVAFMDEFFGAGAPEFRLLYYTCVISLNLLALLIKRKPFSRLSDIERQELVRKLMGNRNPLIRGVVILLSLPIYLSYYRRKDVQVPLGFDAKALKAEADLRTVSRDRDLPSKKEEPE